MNNLTVLNQDGVLLVDSREVAEMVGKRHSDVLESIKGYVKYLTNGDFRSLDFFIENTYTDAKGESRVCYLLTKKGCDMFANKMSGEKGVLFTATYVTKFEEMEKQLSTRLPQTYKEALIRLVEEIEAKEKLQIENAQNVQIINELTPKASYYDLILQSNSLISITQIAKDYGMSGSSLNKLLKDLKVQYKMGNSWLLYQEHSSMGYTQSKTHIIDQDKSIMHTYWTQKGRLFLYDLLKNKKRLVPVMERTI